MKAKLPSKSTIGVITVAAIGLLTWMITWIIGTTVLGKEGWPDWRHDHLGLVFGLWLGSVVVISLPVLWVIGTKLEKAYEKQREEIAASRGVGRVAVRALEGKRAAKERLVDLLDDENVQIRCQAARALVLLSEDWTDREIERRIKYWPGNDKLALIDNLKASRDMRATWVVQLLAEDRNPVIARRAQAALVFVAPKTTRVDGIVRKQKEKEDRRAVKKAPRPAGSAGQAGDGAAGGKPRVIAGAGNYAAVAGGPPAAPEKIDKREPVPRRATPAAALAAKPRPGAQTTAKPKPAAPAARRPATKGRPRPPEPPNEAERPGNEEPAEPPAVS